MLAWHRNLPWKALENLRQQKRPSRHVQSLQCEVEGWSRVSYHLLEPSGWTSSGVPPIYLLLCKA